MVRCCQSSEMTKRLPKENIYGHTKKLRFILEHIDRYINLHGKPIAVLDFGCGNGTALSQYLIKNGINFYGVDIHKTSLDYAREHFADDNVFFLDHIPDGITFDVIVYADILEHLEDPLTVLQQHRNLLTGNGHIIGSVPNGYGPFEIEKKIDKWVGLSEVIHFAGKAKKKLLKQRSAEGLSTPYNIDSGHLQFFTKKSFFLTLQKAQFYVELFKKGAFLGAPLSEQLFRGEKIARLNARVANLLPYWAVSTWYFTAKKNS